MKHLLFIATFLTACAGQRMELADGTKITRAHLGGKDFYSYKRTSAGAITVVSRSDVNDSYNRTVDAASALGTGAIYAGVEKAADAGATAVSLGAQKQATKQAGINAALEAERIKAGVETTRILNPAP